MDKGHPTGWGTKDNLERGKRKKIGKNGGLGGRMSRGGKRKGV